VQKGRQEETARRSQPLDTQRKRELTARELERAEREPKRQLQKQERLLAMKEQRAQQMARRIQEKECAGHPVETERERLRILRKNIEDERKRLNGLRQWLEPHRGTVPEANTEFGEEKTVDLKLTRKVPEPAETFDGDGKTQDMDPSRLRIRHATQ
jgi:hypothetical protein